MYSGECKGIVRVVSGPVPKNHQVIAALEGAGISLQGGTYCHCKPNRRQFTVILPSVIPSREIKIAGSDCLLISFPNFRLPGKSDILTGDRVSAIDDLYAFVFSSNPVV